MRTNALETNASHSASTKLNGNVKIKNPEVAATTWSDPKLAHVGGFESVEDDVSYFISKDEIQGKIPDSFTGTFLRVVPGRNKLQGEKFGHWFDGDGCVHAATFSAEGVQYKHKFVRTPKYIEETKHQRITKRSIGHNAPGGILKNIGRFPENCANTNVIYHANKLLALWEGGLPYELDPQSLDTVGPYRFDGKINRFSSLSAHGSYDPQTRGWYNFGIGYGLKGPQIDLYKISVGGFLVEKASIPVGRRYFLHDFGMSKNYLIFMVSPYCMKNQEKGYLGLSTYDECLSLQWELGMKCYVVAKKDFRLVTEFDIDPFLVFHFSNCWEEGENIIVDIAHLGQPSDSQYAWANHIFTEPTAYYGSLWRFCINPSNNRVTDHQLPGDLPMEFPQWDHRRSGEKTRIIYGCCYIENGTSGFFNAIQRVDLETDEVQVHDLGAGRFTSEVTFVPSDPKGSEEQGHLLALVYNAHTHLTDMVILNAEHLDEIVAVVPLRNHVPHGYHGTYTSTPLML